MKKLIAAPPSTLPCSAVIDCHRNLFSLWLTTGRKLGRSALLHSFTISSKPCCVEAKQRRSANYHPSIWDPKCEFHGTKLKELKKEVTSLLAFAPDPWATWKLIDLMQRLGVAYHFGKEIDEALNNVLKETVIGDLYTTSLLFRILREHAFPISTGDSRVKNEVEVPLRRSLRQKKSAISNDYVVYLEASDYDISHVMELVTFNDVINYPQSIIWIDTMKDEMSSMAQNGVWELIKLPKGCRLIGYKLVYRSKKDSERKSERFKAKLVAKGFTQRDGVYYNETFSPVSSKGFYRIIMVFVAHFDLELHQMDVKIAFLNGNLEKKVYMVQIEGFHESKSESLVCKLQKSIYNLKQASKQWYLKFDKVITSMGFEENKVDQCIYLKINGSKFIFLVLYVDDIMLASNHVGLLHETKQLSSKTFDMKNLGDASFVLVIKIRDRFKLSHCLKNDLERESMKDIPHSSVVGSIIKVDNLEIVGYTYSNFAGCHDDMKSISRAATEAVWLKNLISRLCC
ncbi:Terpene synthase [Theobroma cacao]|nr:Terpene synthase [Theobroma cacao]